MRPTECHSSLLCYLSNICDLIEEKPSIFLTGLRKFSVRCRV